MLSDRWEDVVSNIAVGMGYELIDLELDDSGLVRIFIDMVDNTRDVSVKDCELLTRQLLYQLPVENLAFERLEVSSPGIDRKLTKASHFERFLGSRIKISLKESIDNIKNFEGILRKMKSVEMVMFWKQDMLLNCQELKIILLFLSL